MFRVQCVFVCERSVLIRENTVATHLFRIAQEAVSNAVRHGHATRIEIALTALAERLVLAVSDNGTGFDPARPSGRGQGLRIMNHRAAVCGGAFSVTRGPEGGAGAVCVIENPGAILLSDAP